MDGRPRRRIRRWVDDCLWVSHGMMPGSEGARIGLRSRHIVDGERAVRHAEPEVEAAILGYRYTVRVFAGESVRHLAIDRAGRGQFPQSEIRGTPNRAVRCAAAPVNSRDNGVSSQPIRYELSRGETVETEPGGNPEIALVILENGRDIRTIEAVRLAETREPHAVPADNTVVAADPETAFAVLKQAVDMVRRQSIALGVDRRITVLHMNQAVAQRTKPERAIRALD